MVQPSAVCAQSMRRLGAPLIVQGLAVQGWQRYVTCVWFTCAIDIEHRRTANATHRLHNQCISAQTVCNRLHEANMIARRPFRGPVLTPPRRNARRQWVTQRLRWRGLRWNTVLFGDESHFCLSHGDGRSHATPWRTLSWLLCGAGRSMGWGSVMVWGGIHHISHIRLVFLDGNLNTQRYIYPLYDPLMCHMSHNMN